MDAFDIYAKEICADLIKEMCSGRYAHCKHLPRESTLANTMGISRTQLRDILSVLECEGFITRRHGVGTIINRHVLNVKSRMDMEQEFLHMIHSSGHTPSVAYVKPSEVPASADEAEHLGLAEGTRLLCLSRLCTADKKPAIYCEDLFDVSLVKEPYTDRNLKEPIFGFLQKFCRINCYMDLAEVHSRSADARIAEILNVPEGSSLLYIEEVDYDIEGKPVLFARQYFVDAFFCPTILRKRM